MLRVFAADWSLLLVRAALAVLFGIVALVSPASILVVLFGIYTLIDGRNAPVLKLRHLAAELGQA